MFYTAVAAFAAGVWGAAYCRPGWLWLLTGMLFLAGWLLLCGRDRQLLSRLLLGSLFFLTGLLRGIQADVIEPLDVVRYVGQEVVVVGSVTELPQYLPVDYHTTQVRYIISAETLRDASGTVLPVSGGIMVTLFQPRDIPLAEYQERVSIRGQLHELHGYNNPGRVDSVTGLRLQGISARMTASPNDLIKMGPAPVRWPSFLAAWRQGVERTVRDAMAFEDAAILNGLLFGGYLGIRQQVVDDFAAAGLIHVLSVSGTHIALVAAVAWWLGLVFGLRRRTTAVGAAAAIVLYALAAGLTPPVLRSVIMALMALGAIMLGRDKDAGRALAFAALLMLAWQPGLFYTVSFQLSFGATAGLICLYPRTREWLDFLPKWLAGPLAVTVAAQLGVLPIMAWYFSGLSLAALLANLLVLPLLEGLAVVGLFAAVLLPVLPMAGKVIFALCGPVIGGIVALCGLIAELPGATLYLPPFGGAEAMVFYGVVAWLYGYGGRYLPSPASLISVHPRRTALAAGLATAAIVIYCQLPGSVMIHFIDVGQGDATLLTTPRGRAVLIDAGGSGTLSDFDVGRRVVVPYLRHYGIHKLDYLILTHGHQDHAGGAAGVVSSLPVHTLLLPRGELTSAVQAAIRADADLRMVYAQTGQQITLDGVGIKVVHAAAGGRTGDNEACSVLQIDYGECRFLITGDLSAQGEADMLRSGLGPVTVLKVGHHGARTSTTPAFLSALTPRWAVISVGYANRFGHPHSETLALLAKYQVQVLRTDRDGAIVFEMDGQTIRVKKAVNSTSGILVGGHD